MSENKAPYHWLRKIDAAIVALDEVPLLHAPVDFDWQAFSSKLSKELKKDVVVSGSEQRIWREGSEVTQGIGDDSIFLPFSAAPLAGHVFWVMSEKDVDKLANIMMTDKRNPYLSSSILQESFYRFLCLEALYIADGMKTFDNLSLQMTDDVQAEEEHALCQDIQITIEGHTCIGRICITPTFQKAWNEHFAAMPPITEKQMEKDLELYISIQAGYTALDPKQFKEVKMGDCILLDRGNLNPKTKKGLVSLYLGETPLFHAKIKQHKLKILDYAFYEEAFMKSGDEHFSEEEEIIEEIDQENGEEIKEEISAVAEKPTLSSLKDAPITVVVEVARIKMPLDKILKLGPGNLLDLSIPPEQGVSLTVNGKVIGRGELVSLGEAIGVRILELSN